MSTKDGGHAFPLLAAVGSQMHAESQNGMTLRDYFAGQALHRSAEMFRNIQGATSEKIAAYAYEIADAMLKAREKERTE